MEKIKFKVYYGDSGYDTIDKISIALKPIGTSIDVIYKHRQINQDDDCPYFEYEIVKNDGEFKYHWININPDDYNTYPKEGYDVLVSDGAHYDVAYYIMSGEYTWRKQNISEDDADLFTSFLPIKWTYLK